MNRAELRRSCNVLAPGLDAVLAKQHGERVGFALFLFDFASRDPNASDDEKGNVSYVSNAERADVIALFKEITAYLEAGITTESDAPRGVG